MATINTLLGDQGPLTDIQVPLRRHEYQRRWVHGSHEFVRWILEDVPKLQQGRLNAHDTPQEQLDQILYRWIAGKQIAYSRMFKDLMPGRDEVWELKTADLRVFGWLAERCRFIAVLGDYADHYKGPNRRRSYETARQFVVQYRDRLDLDEPKFVTGNFDALVDV